MYQFENVTIPDVNLKKGFRMNYLNALQQSEATSYTILYDLYGLKIYELRVTIYEGRFTIYDLRFSNYKTFPSSNRRFNDSKKNQ